MKEVQGLSLPVAYMLVYLVRSQVISLQPCGPAVSVSGLWPGWFSPGPANAIASLAESKQTTNDKRNSHLWIIITRSLAL
jgi:hypothetical protein